jgi:hypothetical protein
LKFSRPENVHNQDSDCSLKKSQHTSWSTCILKKMFVHCRRMCETVDVPYRCGIIQNLFTKIAYIQVIPITMLLSYTYSITQNYITQQISLKQDTQISKHQYDQTEKENDMGFWWVSTLPTYFYSLLPLHILSHHNRGHP